MIPARWDAPADRSHLTTQLAPATDSLAEISVPITADRALDRELGLELARNQLSHSSSFGHIFREMQDSLAAANGPHLWPMETAQFLKTRVPAETKAQVQAAAQSEYLTEATWFRRVVEEALRKQASSPDNVRMRVSDDRSCAEPSRDRARIYVRLSHDDRIILRERAVARGMPSATYAAALLRSHLRNLPPLPSQELTALKRAVAELSAVGRNLNQIAAASNRGDRPSGPSKEDLRALLKVCEAVHTRVKDLLKTNLTSWAVGHGNGEG